MQYVMFNLENSTKNAYALTFPFFRFPYEESVSESLIFGEKYNQTSKIIQSKCGICKQSRCCGFQEWRFLLLLLWRHDDAIVGGVNERNTLEFLKSVTSACVKVFRGNFVN